MAVKCTASEACRSKDCPYAVPHDPKDLGGKMCDTPIHFCGYAGPGAHIRCTKVEED